MDKDIQEARKKAIDSLAVAIGFWGVDPVEGRIYGTLFLSPSPMKLEEVAAEVGAEERAVQDKVTVLERLGAVKEVDGPSPDETYYEAEADFFEILQKVLRERQEREMGAALQEISDQRAYAEWRFEEGRDAEVEFLAARLAKLEKFIQLIDKAMSGLKALANLRGFFKGK